MNKPQNIRLTKQFDFEAAHVLTGYDGKCNNIHGHNYILHVTLIGKPIDDIKNPKFGMVIDFSEIKHIVNEIIEEFDHSLLIHKDSPLYKSIESNDLFYKTIPLHYQPTCENMVADFAAIIKPKLPDGIKLHSLKLRETESAFAEWYDSDN